MMLAIQNGHDLQNDIDKWWWIMDMDDDDDDDDDDWWWWLMNRWLEYKED